VPTNNRAAIVGMVFLGESVAILRILCLGLIVIGVISLKSCCGSRMIEIKIWVRWYQTDC
jgi:hypothetical protein